MPDHTFPNRLANPGVVHVAVDMVDPMNEMPRQKSGDWQHDFPTDQT